LPRRPATLETWTVNSRQSTATRRALAAATALATACLVVGGCGGAPPGGAPQGPPGQAAPPGGTRPTASAAVSVIAATVAPRDFTDRFTALGTARATESIEITSRISSVVARINFRESQDVAAGALLVELDNKEIRADGAIAEAALKQSRSQFERSRQLSDTRVISESQLEELEAKMRMDEAALQAAEARLENSFIRAPFAGTVGLRRVSLGDLVGPDTVITTLDDTRNIRLEFAVPENFLSELAAGMTISAASGVYPGRPFTGTVSSIDSRVDSVTRAVTAIATIPNPGRLLKPGMFLTVALERSRRGVLMVPEEALSPRQGRQYLFVVVDGRAVEREVEVGARSPGLAEVRAGIAAGDVVVTEGIQRLRDGVPVQLLSSG
jgi:membrane fusion protein (multidrug efflux system)